jgi:hypothetical protein
MVDLVDGPVRAGAATEDERPRLWAGWAVFNPKVDAYAAGQSRPTQVVIVEPGPD